ncbi:Hypothetical predicted protein [Mytilus galloprovincialis]|uniref:Uncharacterized protein n=1 Tax=Mytilus galloprovincialis TaxID=29158 RepID=A0A8B6HCH9_MYTGA|nr:Hypothetical predicted protein [Mytilus galloprovincialis]
MDKKLKSPAAEKITTMYSDTLDVITKARCENKESTIETDSKVLEIENDEYEEPTETDSKVLDLEKDEYEK